MMRMVPACELAPYSVPCGPSSTSTRSEEHTSELQSPCNLVCRLLLVKKNRVRNVQQRDAAWPDRAHVLVERRDAVGQEVTEDLRERRRGAADEIPRRRGGRRRATTSTAAGQGGQQESQRGMAICAHGCGRRCWFLTDGPQQAPYRHGHA